MTQDTIKTAVDVASVSTLIGTLAGYLPAVAALLTIIWTTLRIYEYFRQMPRCKTCGKSPLREE